MACARCSASLTVRAAESWTYPCPATRICNAPSPILLAHHLLAYVFMLERDRGRFGSRAAPAPTSCRWARPPWPAPPSRSIARRLPRELGFAAVAPNSLDAVSDRDYILEFLAAAAITGMHLSRLAADLTLWATAEFAFVEIADGFATGSSIMPQKKNPDVAELIRGKSGRLYGNLVAVLTIMKGLPLAYNSDMQEDKEPFFDSVDTLEAILTVLPPMLATLTLPGRADAPGGRRELRDGHRPGRLPRAQGPALPPGPRDRRADRAPRDRARA